MAYDEDLARRVRAAWSTLPMFANSGCSAALPFVSGHMACGVVGDELMLWLGGDGADTALEQGHVRPMDFTGKPIRTMVFVEPAGIATRAPLEQWIGRAVTYAHSVPPKPSKR